MPSKGKKPSRPPPTAVSPSSRTPPPPSARPPDAAPAPDDDAHLRQILSDASTRFPSLISISALCVRVSESDASPSKGNNATLWLSEAAMLSSSIPIGSLVSVSLPAVGHKPKPYNGFLPLNTLAEGSNLSEGRMVDEAGCYFAIATVFPSRKVVNDGVRLSWGLSCTMGFPDLGRAIFVSLIRGTKSQSVTQNVIVCNCEDLYLDMVLLKDGEISGDKSFSGYYAKAELVGVQIGNGNVESPKTPFQSRLSSPGASPAQSVKCQERLLSRNASLHWDLSAAMLALEDEKVKDLLQIFAARWLYGRHLLAGNLVTVPICGQQCAFRVNGAGKLQAGRSNQSLTYEDGDELWISRCKSLDKVTSALLVDTKTRIHLCDLKSSIIDSPKKWDLSAGDSTTDHVGIKEAADIPRVGGLSKEYAALKEIIMFSLGEKKGLPGYKGVLLYGPPGTGKTSLASSCALDAGARLFTINGPEIVSQYYGESEQALDKVFETAKGAAPAVIFIDELDAIAPARKEGGEGLSRRMVGTLLKLMDEKIVDGVLVIAATNRPDTIDPALRRPGRLDREIEIGVPSPDQRLDIMRTLLVGMDHSLSDQEIHSLAFATHGFVGADLAALCNEAAFAALHRHINLRTSGKTNKGISLGFDGSLTDMHANVQKDGDSPCGDKTVSLLSSLSKLTLSHIPGEQEDVSSSHYGVYKPDEVESKMLLTVTAEDFRKAKMKVRPSAMREVLLELPNVRWEDVGGQDKVKKQLIEAVLWPQICPDAFERIGIQPPRGLLMIGPPGCSKTLMARAVASEAKLNFLAVKGPELFSKWVGESEKAVKSLFAKARTNSPAIIFFDEIDGLAVTRGQENDSTSVADRVLNQLLVEMEGLNQRLDVTVIAATNRPDKIDPALLRPGRFDRILDVQPPDEADREDIFQIHMRGIPCSSDVSVKDLARMTEGYTGADIKLICREAALAALEESLDIPEVSMAHFKAGIGRVQPSDIQFYKELAAQFRRIVDI